MIASQQPWTSVASWEASPGKVPAPSPWPVQISLFLLTSYLSFPLNPPLPTSLCLVDSAVVEFTVHVAAAYMTLLLLSSEPTSLQLTSGRDLSAPPPPFVYPTGMQVKGC